MKLVSKKESAVSPVIGTILLVAITVVLVAIIAAVVMPMVGGVGNTHVTGVQVEMPAYNDVNVTISSGELPYSLVFRTGSTDVEVGTVGTYKVGKYNVTTLAEETEYSLVAKYSANGEEQILWTGKTPAAP